MCHIHSLCYGSCFTIWLMLWAYDAKLILFVDVIIFYLFDNKQLRKTKKTLKLRKVATAIRVLL